MTIKTSALALLLGSLLPALNAAPLSESTPVKSRADAAAPTVATLPKGTEPKVTAAAAPAGWIAVEIAGPHDVFVQNKDITKALDVRPGAELRAGPKLDAPVLAVAQQGESLDITELVGRWTKLRLTRPITGYIKAPLSSAPAAAALPAASIPAGNRPTASDPAPAPFAPPPARPAVYGSAQAGQAAPIVSLGDQGSAALPRSFQGRFVTTRSPFKPRRPYDWALTDETGTRFAYLDVSRLLQTEQIEKYVDHFITVYGATKPVPGTKDFVIVVESLQLK